MPNPTGLCQCGCGESAPLAAYNDSKRGYVKGQPMRYRQGHGTAGKRRKPLETMYVAEDRGHPTPCWIWQGGMNDNGYGRTSVRGTMRPAHLVFYEREHGPAPAGTQIDHLCRVPSCVNPAHLEPTTATENVRRSRATKLCARQAEEIKAAREHGRTSVELGPLYGVTPRNIRAIWEGRSWTT